MKNWAWPVDKFHNALPQNTTGPPFFPLPFPLPPNYPRGQFQPVQSGIQWAPALTVWPQTQTTREFIIWINLPPISWLIQPSRRHWHSIRSPYDTAVAIAFKLMPKPKKWLLHVCRHRFAQTTNHLKIHISKTTGPISTIFGHKIDYLKGQITSKNQVWIPSVSWENPLFVSKLEAPTCRPPTGMHVGQLWHQISGSTDIQSKNCLYHDDQRAELFQNMYITLYLYLIITSKFRKFQVKRVMAFECWHWWHHDCALTSEADGRGIPQEIVHRNIN